MLHRELPRVEVRYTRAVEPHEFEGAFQCLYHSYERRGLVRRAPLGVRLTRYHLLPATRVFVARIGRQVVGTLSLVPDNPLGVPMRSVFRDWIETFARKDPRITEATCLAIRDAPLAGPEIVHRLMGLAAQSAKRQGVSRIVIAVHPRHASFYEKVAGFRRFGPVQSYPSVGGRPAVPLQLDLVNLSVDYPDVYERYFGMKFTATALAATPAPSAYLQRIAAVWQRLHCEESLENDLRPAPQTDEELAA